jgi:lysophospholipid hydrolase
MEDLGIPIDVVSGTSFGALTGAIYSMTAAEPGSMMRVVERVMGSRFTNRGMLADFNFPRTACFTGQYLNSVLQQTFARRRCEDMLVPFVCTSTDILNFEAKSHREGPLWRIIRASMSLVGFVPPLPHQEHCTETGQDVSSLLVDGGYTNLFPTEDLRQLGAGTVICVKACPDFEAVSTDYGDSVRGGAISALRKLGIPWRWYKGPDPPNQGEIQERLMYLPDMMKGRGKDGLGADILIKPPIAGYGVLCFSKYRELIQKGYDVALPALTAWLEGKEGERGDYVRTVIEQLKQTSGQEIKPCNATLLESEFGSYYGSGLWRTSLPKAMSTPAFTNSQLEY